MPREADVVVVGGGITGVATFHALARSKARTILLEQFELGHARGSSHGTSRIFRLSYTDPTFTRLAQEALAGWRTLERESGEQLIVHTGSLDLGDAAAETARSLAAAGADYELLNGDAALQRWRIAAEPSEQLVFEPTGGYIRADLARKVLATAARARGGVIVEQARAIGIDATDGQVVVSGHATEISAGAVVVAAGAWVPTLAASLGLRVPVVPARETVAYYACPGAEDLPAVIEYPSTESPLPDGQAYYALPAPGRGLKAGIHHSGGPADPDEPGVADDAVVAATSAWIARRFPEVDPAPLATETCLYTNTADESFVIERHDRIVIASACSGHGFKFAPLLGERIAALALESARA